MRCGDSKKTVVRGSVASPLSHRAFSPVRRGAKPSKQNRSHGRPDRASAVVTAEGPGRQVTGRDRKSTRLNSSHSQISSAVFCLKKKKQNTRHTLGSAV